MILCDAHTHYHFAGLREQWPGILTAAQSVGVASAVVNGTGESDWEAVATFVRENPWTRAAYGIHPWHAWRRSPDWEVDLGARLTSDPQASVGEIGLDAWVPGHDLADQIPLFLRQWSIANEHRRPISVHCVKAWDALRQSLKPLPSCPTGFLIHAYNGPPEWIPWFVEKGAYFSYSPYFLADRKQPQREAFRFMPHDRILIETDAPELSPPPDRNPWLLSDPATGRALNHPANLLTALLSLAETLSLDPATAARLTTENWLRLFGKP